MEVELKYYQRELIDKMIESINRGYKHFTLFMMLGTGRLMTELSVAVVIGQNGIGNRVLYICESIKAVCQAHNLWENYFYGKEIYIEFITWQKVNKNMHSVPWDYYDIVILQNVPPASRKKICDKIQDSKQITISVSEGPYTEETQYKKEPLIVSKDKSKRADMYKIPGIYLIQTKNIIDVRDIQNATIGEIEDIKATIANNLDYFVSYKQFVEDGFIKEVSYEKDNLKRRIKELENREKELLALIEREGKSNG